MTYFDFRFFKTALVKGLGVIALLSASPVFAASDFTPSWFIKTLLDQPNVVRAFFGDGFTDKNGEHALLLTREETTSRLIPDSSRLERQFLKAELFVRDGNSAKSVWKIQEENDCPTLDSEAVFFTKFVSVTDLDGNGEIEVIVPYRVMCAGDVSPKSIKVILRQGKQKLALRGNSRIVVAGEGYGGDYVLDEALNRPENKVFREKILKIWKSIFMEKYE